MASLWIVNEDRSIRAEIVPAHGGMVAQIELEGKELLHIDRGQLETAPMAAGGMPILFPFPSKTKDDAYQFKGKQYHMPMHGLVKNDVFAVGETGENRARLWLENSPSWKAQYYPFDFRLEVEYRLEKNSLTVLFGIENRGDEAMPHYLGWHPFFKSTDKKRIRLWQDMRVHYDYGARWMNRGLCWMICPGAGTTCSTRPTREALFWRTKRTDTGFPVRRTGNLKPWWSAPGWKRACAWSPGAAFPIPSTPADL